MAARPIPEGYRTLTPYFSVRRADKFIEFLKAAFDATVNFVIKGPGSTVMSSEILVGDSLVMVGGRRRGVQPNARHAVHVRQRCGRRLQESHSRGCQIDHGSRRSILG